MARAGYERLSKDRGLRGINVAIQRAEIDDYAADTDDPIAQHFCDNDTGASEFETKPRDDYINLIAFIMRGLVDEIIVTEVPRLSRSSEEALELVRLSKSTPLRYITTTDGMKYDLHTPRGRKAFREAVSDAEFESDQTSARQHRKKNKLAEAGAFHGGQRPFGYEGAIYEQLVTPDGEKIKGRLLNPGRVGVVIIDEEADIRREGTNRIIAGEREIDLVRDFNQRRIPTPGGGKWRNGNLRRLLSRKRDVAFDDFPGPGTRVHKGREYRAVWPALISRADHELLLAAFKLRSSGHPAGMINGRQYLLSGIVRCTHGHGPMYGRGKKVGPGMHQRRYGCHAQNSYGERIPGLRTFRLAEPVDLWVTEAVLEALNTPEVVAALAPEENQDRVMELVELQAKQRLHLTQLVSDYGASVLSRAEFLIAKQSAQASLQRTEDELSQLQRQRATSTVPRGTALREFFDGASIEMRRQIILTVVDHVIIKPSTSRSVKWRGYRFNPDDCEIVWRV